MCQHVLHGGQVFATPGELSKVVGGVESSSAPNTKARWIGAYAASTSAPTLDRAGLTWKQDNDPMVFRKR